MLGCTMLVCLFSLKKLVSWTSSYFTTQHFNEVREKKIAAIKSSNTKWAALVVTKISPQDASKITELSFEDLCRVLQSGEVSATQALQAYQYKAVKENAKHNFICEAVAEAEGIAAKLDALTAEERRSLPLFGVPISLKETYMLEGYDCTVGCVKLINKPMKETSSIVKMLVTQGAVPFIRTNIPQTCMSFDSVNPIYGTTSNPHDPLRSCGGSSGGEGAAIGACSSILGLGTDIGGSIRIPAAFCGIYSLKPTAGRLSFHSDVGVDYNGRIVTVTCGPMGRDVNSLIAAMKVLSMPESHLVDPFVPPIPFNEKGQN
ncbi:FAAH [Bugula neritina]|uniref:FAAH n=1 Tax=Bugula neritina TaxID=10212 RepID=A0A7J7J350_BUGNE|nr:FAAH [Bugula neritina]